MSSLNEIVITVSGDTTPDKYYARSYPDDDFDNNGKIELYGAPVYKVYVDGNSIRKEWKALRFMPFWNDPKNPSSSYSSRGWINSGLVSAIHKKAVTYYDPDYGTHNRYSPYSGAIQIKGNFLIHAGPETLLEYGWGAAGCVEIIGNFDNFKDDIRILSNSSKTDSHEAILELVSKRKLFIKVEFASPPDLKSNFWKEN